MNKIDKDTLCKIAMWVDAYSIEIKSDEYQYAFWRNLHYSIQEKIKNENLTNYYYDNYFFENIVKNENLKSIDIENKYPLDEPYINKILNYMNEVIK